METLVGFGLYLYLYLYICICNSILEVCWALTGQKSFPIWELVVGGFKSNCWQRLTELSTIVTHSDPANNHRTFISIHLSFLTKATNAKDIKQRKSKSGEPFRFVYLVYFNKTTLAISQHLERRKKTSLMAWSWGFAHFHMDVNDWPNILQLLILWGSKVLW